MVGVALIGYGAASKIFHEPLINAVDGLELRTIVRSRKESIEPVLADKSIDLVVIATPNDSHASLARQALDAGKHVVVDKPMAVSLAEASELAEHARHNKGTLSVFHNRRWDSDFLTLRALIEGGDLGHVVEISSHFDRYRPTVTDRWRDQPGPGAGVWFDLGAHLADQALVLFGEPDAVSADIALTRAGARVDDYFAVTLHYPGRRIHLHGTCIAAAHDLRYRVHGTRASFVKHGFDPQEAALKAGRVESGEDPRPGELVGPESRVLVAPIPGNYRAYYEGMRDAVTKGTPPPVTADEAVRVMRILEAARQSSEVGHVVSLR